MQTNKINCNKQITIVSLKNIVLQILKSTTDYKIKYKSKQYHKINYTGTK